MKCSSESGNKYAYLKDNIWDIESFESISDVRIDSLSFRLSMIFYLASYVRPKQFKEFKDDFDKQKSIKCLMVRQINNQDQLVTLLHQLP